MGTTQARRADDVELVGRDRDLRRVRAFVEDTAEFGQALLLTGAPGVGKTALLDAAARQASDRGMRVLRAAGAKFETSMAFATLHQLLLPIRSELADHDDTAHPVFRAVLDAHPKPPIDHLAFCDATLTMLGGVARWLGMLVVVDDLQWVDQQSATVLASLARRLTGTRIKFIGAIRSDEGALLRELGLPEHEVEPLDDTAARRLLEDHFPALTAPVRKRTLADAAGSPLALLELPPVLAGTAPSRPGQPHHAPMTRRLQSVFGAHLADVSSDTRWMLLMAALDANADLRNVVGEGAERLADAERARLIRLDEQTGSVEFAHPLIRAAVVSLSTVIERRLAAEQLAELHRTRRERRGPHLAVVTADQNRSEVAVLEEAAT